MNLDNWSKGLVVTGSIFYLLVTILSLNQAFFWDTILTSNIAQWFYENGIGNGLVPTLWDAGHPTLFQIALAGTWNIWGKSLPVTHLFMLPFLMMSVYFLLKILSSLEVSKNAKIVGLLLFLAHPYILTQSTLISYDTLQVTFFLITVYAILQDKKGLLFVGIIALETCSIRGQIIAFACMMGYLFLYRTKWRQALVSTITFLTPIFIWHFYHYTQAGWFLSTPSELWNHQRGLASFIQIIKNIFGIARPFIDYGMIALSGVCIIALLKSRLNCGDANTQKVFIITLFNFLFLIGGILFFTNPIGHRYFMVIHTGMIILVAVMWEQLKFKKLYLSIIMVCFISGHFWIYPSKYSNGWDVIMTYFSYNENRTQLIQYLSENKIPFDEIASSFPLFNSLKQTNLSDDTTRMQDITTLENIKTKYVAYSAVCNDMTTIFKEKVLKDYHEIKRFGFYTPTSVILYEKD
ncbi:MAG: hypothetical protein M9887_12330 [Chitinophagales bacterium]|nr:hypothetical protein [Chitinophagales bacterium]